MTRTARQRELACRLPARWTPEDLSRAACISLGAARAYATRLVNAGQADGDPAAGYVFVQAADCDRRKEKPKPIDQLKKLKRTGPRGAADLAVTVYDAAGRSYRARYQVVYSHALTWSHMADGRAIAGFPPELQARDRSGAGSVRQLFSLARVLSPERLVARSSSAADGAPVCGFWSAGHLVVLSGNGRTAAIVARASTDPEWAKEYADAIREAWPTLAWPRAGDASIPVLVRVLETTDRAELIRFAGGSQGVDTAPMTLIERLRSLARAYSLTDRTPALTWTREIDASRVHAMLDEPTNHGFRKWLRARVPDGTLEDPETCAEVVHATLVALARLEDSPTWRAPHLAAALLGVLPALYTLHCDVAAGRVLAEWDVWGALPKAGPWLAKAGSDGINALLVRMDADARQRTMFDDGADAGERDELLTALVVWLVRASRRADPASAAAGYAAAYRERALELGDAGQSTMFGGPSPSAPSAAALSIARVAANPTSTMTKHGRWMLELGREVLFECVDGVGQRHTYELHKSWSIACDPESDELLIVQRVGRALRIEVPRAVRKAWRRWSLEDVDDVHAYQVPTPGQEIGRYEIEAICYLGRLQGWRGHRRHVFERERPFLVFGRTAPTIDRARSRYCLTARGIVG